MAKTAGDNLTKGAANCRHHTATTLSTTTRHGAQYGKFPTGGAAKIVGKRHDERTSRKGASRRATVNAGGAGAGAGAGGQTALG
ncbi:hypothetical protein AA0119_g11498 [Alternaria tenuissima]|uniref:Uncharacterized protein n=2 Tax=Alternaria alternata complex TaxID=187734 RepID=A0A4Q4MZ54_ALTAL|nr:hypothetical protein AA0117_g12290 [Alternaria alternata]RYN89275.1 hypothetical protein AA0119_g11498 [Alternaria tenuissima]RYO04887.1 hypothetical protein AA0121_g12590 [Alternaria tenuissima]RYO47932.1 hypothetical protein AA0116_g12810 [Alternaria tenuissima]